MKRNISLIVLTCEILAIVVLHAVKINQTVPQKSSEINNTISKANSNVPAAKQYSLVILK